MQQIYKETFITSFLITSKSLKIEKLSLIWNN